MVISDEERRFHEENIEANLRFLNGNAIGRVS